MRDTNPTHNHLAEGANAEWLAPERSAQLLGPKLSAALRPGEAAVFKAAGPGAIVGKGSCGCVWVLTAGTANKAAAAARAELAALREMAR